jgi:hypothetical protein
MSHVSGDSAEANFIFGGVNLSELFCWRASSYGGQRALSDLHPRSHYTAIGETKSQDYMQDKKCTS